MRGAWLGWLISLAACDPPDPRCTWALPDPAQLGACSAILGWYYDHGACRSVSGCACADCEEPVPFSSEEDCAATCG